MFSTELTGDARLINVYNVIFVKLLCDIFSFRVEFSVIVRPKQTNTLNIHFFLIHIHFQNLSRPVLCKNHIRVSELVVDFH